LESEMLYINIDLVENEKGEKTHHHPLKLRPLPKEKIQVASHHELRRGL